MGLISVITSIERNRHAFPHRKVRLPLVGFLPATDPRMRATIDAGARELTQDGLAGT